MHCRNILNFTYIELGKIERAVDLLIFFRLIEYLNFRYD